MKILRERSEKNTDKVLLSTGLLLLGKEAWRANPGQKGLYLDVEGQGRWNPTSKTVREVLADDYSEGREWKMSESGALLMIPGRVQADEFFGSNGPELQLHTEDDVFVSGSSSVVSAAWDLQMVIPGVAVKGKSPENDAKGYVGFTYSRPCLHLWVPDRAYATTRHITEVILGVEFEGILHRSGGSTTGKKVVAGLENRGSVLKTGVRFQSHTFEMSYIAHGPDVDAKKLEGSDLKQVAQYIKSVWLPAAQSHPERWKILCVKTAGTKETIGQFVEEPKGPLTHPLLERPFRRPRRSSQKSELQKRIEKGDFGPTFLAELGGKTHGIPNDVFLLFEQGSLVSSSMVQTVEERANVVWAFRQCATVFVDEQLGCHFGWLTSTLLSSPDLCADWSQHCCNRRDMKPYVAVAWLAQDALKLWGELPAVDKRFLDDIVPRIQHAKRWSRVKLHELRGVLNHVQCRFIMMDHLMRAQEVKLALFILRETPYDVLRSAWVTPGKKGKTSYFHLYPVFVDHGDHESAEDLVDRLADAYLNSPSDPLEALMSFMGSGETAGQRKRDLLISFVSACRCKGGRRLEDLSEVPSTPTTPTNLQGRLRLFTSNLVSSSSSSPTASLARKISFESTQPKRPSFDRAASTSADKPPAPPLEVMPKLELVMLERILNNFEARVSSLSVEDAREIGEMVEAVLLIASGNNIAEWAESLQSPRLELAQRLLRKVVSQHVGHVLRATAGWQVGLTIGQYFKYDDAAAQQLIVDGFKWRHDYYGSRYFSEATVRSCFDCCQLIYMYIKLDFAVYKCISGSICKLFQVLEADSQCFSTRLNVIAPKDTTLRTTICDELTSALPKGAFAMDDLQKLISYTGFFDSNFQKFLKRKGALESCQRDLPSSAFLGVLHACLKIIGLKALRCDVPLEEVIPYICDVCRSDQLAYDLVLKVCDAIVAKNPEEFFPGSDGAVGFRIGDLHGCARRIQVAAELIKYKMKAGRNQSLNRSARSIIDSFLRAPPCTWQACFGTIDKYVYVLEYMGKEDLNLAYQQLRKDLEDKKREATSHAEAQRAVQLIELVECVKKVYSKPLLHVDASAVGSMHEDADITTMMKRNAKKLTAPIKWCGMEFLPEDWDDIIEIAATTTEAMKERFSVLMLPHHTQMITFIMFAIRACGAGENLPLPQSMLARVGTGEGKSWIIGMLAAFVARKGKRMKTSMRAHVVVDNVTLKSRDFSTVSRFFSKLGIQASKEGEHLRKSQYEVVYCTGAEIYAQCRICQETGQAFEDGVRNAVLIVDEVDGLIIDGDANIQYMYPDATLSYYADYWLRQLENGIQPEAVSNDPRHEISSEELELTLRRVEDAYEQAQKAEKGKDFEWRGGQMYMINKSTGLLAVGWWDLWFEIRHWIDTEWQGMVTYKCIKSILCKKRCFTSYSSIFGLTGSLGQKAEQEYLRTHYDAVTFNIPYFLDTCRLDDGRHQGRAVLRHLNKDDIVQPDEETQIRKVVELATQKCQDVPVIIIAKDQAKVEEVARRVCVKLGEKPDGTGAGGWGLDERVIRLLEKPGDPERFATLVDLATQPWDRGATRGAKRSWRVTVTTAEGGRGHDYRVGDPHVDENGGILLILMWVSWSQREWIQFLGRTARQDHEGQIAVYLNAESQDLVELASLGVDLGRSTGSQAVEKILDAGDTKMKNKFKNVSSQISRGSLLHDLTSRYWRKQKLGTTQKQEFVWRKLCREYLHEHVTLEAMSKEFNKAFPSEDEHRMIGGHENERSDDEEGYFKPPPRNWLIDMFSCSIERKLHCAACTTKAA